MSTLSTHVLDTALGRPAKGIRVTLEQEGNIVGSGTTDADGRVRDLLVRLAEGNYLLRFSVGDYFSSTGRESFYPEIVVNFHVAAGGDHYHVPLLLSPFGYTTYRGS